MVINRNNMDALFATYNTAFTAAMQRRTERANPNELQLSDIAMILTSTGSATVHAWLGQVKGMREWVGARVVENIETGALTVVNRNFENTVGVKRNLIEDDQYGQFAPLIGAMGDAAEELWLELAIAALLENGDWADGNPFFCTGRKLGDGTVTNAVKAALSKTAVETAIATIGGYTLQANKPAKARPHTLIVGPSQAGLARQICEAAIIADNGAGVSNVSTATMLKVRVSADLVGDHASKWFVLADKATIQAVAVQKRKLPVLTRMDADGDINVFMSNEYMYGTDARGEAFPTLPFLAYASNPGADPVAWAEVA